MAERKESFTVTDRRLFTPDGELRKDSTEEIASSSTPSPSSDKTAPSAAVRPASTTAQASPSETPQSEQVDAPPTAAEQQAGADAYQQSSKNLDSQVELSGHSAKDLEMTFERFMASLYMTAMLQLGLMREQNAAPSVDLIGARQTIDTLSIVAEKTKGNLTPAENNFLQNCLYELRMAYVEVTNALSRPPQTGDPKVKTH
jgi:cytoskeletal protein RodZ